MNQYDRVDRVFEFFFDKYTKNQLFTLEEIGNISGWKKATVKTYLNKLWKDILKEESGEYAVTEVIEALNREKFRAHHSQNR